MNKKRAQAWGYDVIAGLTIFVIGIFTFYLFSLNYSNGGDSELDQLEYQGNILGDALLSEGYPKYWVKENFVNGSLERIGLLTDGVINQTKLNQFYQIGEFGVSPSNYQKTKGILGIENEFLIDLGGEMKVLDSDNNLQTITSIGKTLSGENNLARVSRFISNGSDLRTVNIYVWN